jgi:effector-binding domain-containing protein
MLEPTIKQTDPVTVAYKAMRGEYAQIPEGYRSLYTWVDHYGLRPTGAPQAIFLTMPEITPEGAAEWELWAPIAGGAGNTSPDEEGFGVKRVEPETVASVMHKGPYNTLDQTYRQLEAWVAEQGYQVVGPPREVYLTKPDTPPEDVLTEVQMPVARA